MKTYEDGSDRMRFLFISIDFMCEIDQHGTESSVAWRMLNCLNTNFNHSGDIIYYVFMPKVFTRVEVRVLYRSFEFFHTNLGK